MGMAKKNYIKACLLTIFTLSHGLLFAEEASKSDIDHIEQSGIITTETELEKMELAQLRIRRSKVPEKKNTEPKKNDTTTMCIVHISESSI